jgi:type IV fimbrial biogenesis protein FimT
MILSLNLRQSGFTLVELIIAVIIGGILVSLTIPVLTDLVQNNRQAYYTNEFTTFMQLARSEAIKRGVSAGVTATDTSDNTNEWGPGWTVWADRQGGTQDVMDANEVLRVSVAAQGQITIDSRDGNATYRYDPDGSLAAGANDAITICDSSRTGETSRVLTTTATGRLNLDTSQTCP